MEILLLLTVFTVLPVFVAYKITSDRGRGAAIGIVLGLLLGWLGVIITLFLADRNAEAEEQQAIEQARQRQQMYRECPHCKEQMRRDASVCPHCHQGSRAWEQRGGRWWSQTEAGEWFWLDETAKEWKPAEPTAAATGPAMPPLAISADQASSSEG